MALVEYHNLLTNKIELCILGAQQGPEEVFTVTQKVYQGFRLLWIAHGERMQPSYEYQKKPTMVEDISNSGTPKRKTTGTELNLYTPNHIPRLLFVHAHPVCKQVM